VRCFEWMNNSIFFETDLIYFDILDSGSLFVSVSKCDRRKNMTILVISKTILILVICYDYVATEIMKHKSI